MTHLDALRARLAKATPGPWVYAFQPKKHTVIGQNKGKKSKVVAVISRKVLLRKNDAELITHASTDLALLLRCVEEAQALLARFNGHHLGDTTLDFHHLRDALAPLLAQEEKDA